MQQQTIVLNSIVSSVGRYYYVGKYSYSIYMGTIFISRSDQNFAKSRIEHVVFLLSVLRVAGFMHTYQKKNFRRAGPRFACE
jgi:hypothetical protein